MKKDNNSIPERFFEEKLPDIWSVNKDRQSFDKLQLHDWKKKKIFAPAPTAAGASHEKEQNHVIV